MKIEWGQMISAGYKINWLGINHDAHTAHFIIEEKGSMNIQSLDISIEALEDAGVFNWNKLERFIK